MAKYDIISANKGEDFMSIKTGIDIIEVSRIRKNIEKYGEKFLHRVFTENEITYCESKNVQKFQSYAGRFAAKEAVFKALSDDVDNKFEIEWKDIEILNDESGKPRVFLHGKLEKISCYLDVSISHVESMAVANAVAVCE